MLAKRIIPCLDVKDGHVVKGVQFRDHQIVGDILELAMLYRNHGADELVFYDITASSDNRRVDRTWISQIADILDIPFCVAGGIRSPDDARDILTHGADKISINSPALETPQLIDALAREFGSQCVVIGIDSREEAGSYYVYQYTGSVSRVLATQRKSLDWALEVIKRGAGEIVLNCMNQDGMRQGYDIKQLREIRNHITIPLIASGGAGSVQDFADVFNLAHVDGALAASVFHKKIISVSALKLFLKQQNIPIRL